MFLDTRDSIILVTVLKKIKSTKKSKQSSAFHVTQKTVWNVGYSLSINRGDENIAFNMELKNLSSTQYSSEATGRNTENSSYFKVHLLREAYTEHKNTFLKK